MSSSSCLSTKHLILSLGLVSLFISTALAIHCWDCSSHIHPGCGEPFKNHTFAQIDCDQKVMPHLQGQKATLCRKIIQKVEGDSRPRVVRSCGWILDESVNKACVKRSGTFSVLMEYCSCDQDGCNAAFSSLTANNSFSLVVKMFLSFIVSLYCLQRRQVSLSLL